MNADSSAFRTRLRARFALAFALVLVACGGDDGGKKWNGDSCSTENEFDFPFTYTMSNGRLEIETAGGPLKTVVGPWGAHAPPHTGHAEGNGKADWAGLFAETWDDPIMATINGSVATEGGCAPESDCAVNLDEVTSRIPYYVAPPGGFLVTEVTLESVEDSHALDSHKWLVVGRMCPYQYGLGHLGSIASELRTRLMERGAADPELQTEPATIFLDYENPIALAPATPIAVPQIRYTAHPNAANYATGWGGVGATPWAQIEFGAIRYVGDKTDIVEAEWNFLPPAKRAQVEQVLFTEGLVENSLKYGWAPEWLWRSEMVLEATAPFVRGEADDLFSRFGGWWEAPEGACEPYVGADCDMQLSIFPIHTESPLYDETLYEPNVGYLVSRRVPGGEAYGEVLSPTSPDPIADLLLVKWRPQGEPDEYQQMAYRVTSNPTLLVMRFGEAKPTEEELPAHPTIPTGAEDCADPDVDCFRLDAF